MILLLGDCDNDSDCCNGLKCDYDWGFKTDYCIAGNYNSLTLKEYLSFEKRVTFA